MAVATEREYGLWINGESAEPASGEVRELGEPATGEPLARVAVAAEDDVDRAVEAAQAALAGDWDEKDATRLANDVRYGLMATVWTGDPARGHRLARRIKAGTVGINMPYTAFPGIPFGGYKQSGFGRELGLETLELYLETKSVLVSTSPKPFNPFGL
jgi:acyl-CoA reductase-like NAD-dependent aldehyde dehydrogenase